MLYFVCHATSYVVCQVCVFISLVLLLLVLPVSFFVVQYPPSYWRKLAHKQRLGLVRRFRIDVLSCPSACDAFCASST